MSIIPRAARRGYTALEPNAAELAQVEAEAPLIAAELELLNAEIRVAMLGQSASALDHRRVRRAVRRVLAVSRTLAAHQATRQPVTGGVA